MLFIMEGIDLALLIQIFKGFKSTLPRPTPQVLQIFLGAGRTSLARDTCVSKNLDMAHFRTPDQTEKQLNAHHVIFPMLPPFPTSGKCFRLISFSWHCWRFLSELLNID